MCKCKPQVRGVENGSPVSLLAPAQPLALPCPRVDLLGGGQGPALVSVENPSLCGRQGSRAELEGTASGVGLRGTLRGTA